MSRLKAAIAPLLRPLRLLSTLCLIGFCLTGCVDYQLGIAFDSPNKGTVTQTIHLEGLGTAAAQSWLSQLETQTRNVRGQMKRLSRQDVAISIPFSSAKDLEQKFNQFFTPFANPATTADRSALPEIVSNLQVKQSNLLLFERDRLAFDVDLTALSLPETGSETLLNPEQMFDLSIGVTGPWGAGGQKSTPIAQGGKAGAKGATWQLQSGKKNHIEAVLWMPMPLGWGTVLIAGLVAGGIYYRKQQIG
ncbi:DUF3153 domain-containing protein [Alkalinema sp. FACHB-956]|uniref:DUF3153 domain-containing protein n=1 Tax=Alkalinema sp. FACHB-956 TaxID=2692768 RepID=UPI001687FF94|nr:DUF3153 domain-containing protein [Alkalinema sp. FACHB-956]MBD2326129.1 DUF3153 domain-containing protein [Alkalinema sp. FACHB-956]